MKTVTRFCKGCGKIMYDVDPRRKLCDRCQTLPPQERINAPKSTRTKPKVRPRKAKSLAGCVREANALGISYGQYVARGLDRM